MKKLIILAAALMLAMPAFAAVQNVKVSGDITTYGVLQSNLDLDADDTTDGIGKSEDDGFFATITRLRIDADLTDNVAATIRMVNEREWGAATNASTDIDVDLANITLKEMFYSPLTMIIGRQDLAYGSKLVVGDPNTNATIPADSNLSHAPFLSKMKAFDAIRGIMDYDPLTIDLVYAKIDENYEASDTGVANQDGEDVDLLGANLSYKFADYDAEAEGYVFYVDGNQDNASQDIAVLGLRGSLVPVDGLTLGAEVAWQTGDYSITRDQDAMAATVEGSYTWNNEYEPTIKLCYDYRSGNSVSHSSTGDYEAWDPLYEDQTKGLIADYLFAGINGGVNSNASIINLGGSIKPMEDLTLSLDWFNYTLVEDFGSATTVSGGPGWSNVNSSTVLKANEDGLGDEIDLGLTYDYSEDVVIGLQAGWFLPGDLFTSANDDDAMEVIGSIAVSF